MEPEQKPSKQNPERVGLLDELRLNILETLEGFLGAAQGAGPQESQVCFDNIHIVVNPAAGQDEPILHTLHTIFSRQKINWQIYVTKRAGDGWRFTRDALDAGAEVVAAYGGDGTVMEVASALAETGSSVPLAILPGGTGNAVAVELGIPRNLVRSAALICGAPSVVRPVDIGKADKGAFMLRASAGLPALIGPGATREIKDRIGLLAYPLSALKYANAQEVARYEITMDGNVVSAEGVLCMVINSSTLGLPGTIMAPGIAIDDGLLDVIVLSYANLAAIADLAVTALTGEELGPEFRHWQAAEVTVVADPPQPVVLDGEPTIPTPLHAKAIHEAVRVIVPHQSIRPLINTYESVPPSGQDSHSTSDAGDKLAR